MGNKLEWEFGRGMHVTLARLEGAVVVGVTGSQGETYTWTAALVDKEQDNPLFRSVLTADLAYLMDIQPPLGGYVYLPEDAPAREYRARPASFKEREYD